MMRPFIYSGFIIGFSAVEANVQYLWITVMKPANVTIRHYRWKTKNIL